MLLLARTLRLSCLALRKGGIPCSTVFRPTFVTSAGARPGLNMGGDELNGSGGGGVIRPQVPMSSVTAFGQNLGQDELKSLGKELEAANEGERLVSPFVGKVYDVSNAALFYAHNGRLDSAQEQLDAGFQLVASELKGVDEAGSRDGIRQDRVSGSLENLVKAKAFVHFLRTGRLLRKSAVEGEIEDGEYLGAAMRLTAELARYAITQASILDRSSIRACASLCRGVFGELVQFDLRNGPLRKKFDGVKYDVRKVDDILYELALKEFEVIRVAMTAFDEKRETVIKRTRDIQKWSKMAIYSLHRGDTKKAEKQLSDCRKAADGLLPLINETPRLRMGAFSCSMEEFAEARLYELWLKEKKIATRKEVGLVNTEEYLGGLLDLTGELNRFAVARATERDSVGVKECLETVLVIHEFVTLNALPGRLPKKKGELFNSLRKLQNMTYELALMKAGKGKVSGVSGVDDGPAGGGGAAVDKEEA
ncbi:unnamed protein product [Scytosiphon promiscuus]